MFKIANLKKTNNEQVTIKPIKQEVYYFDNGKKTSQETFNTLSFEISGDNYSLSFELNCKIEKLLDIPMHDTISFNDYIFEGESYLSINGTNGANPDMNVKITRYLKNRFILFITFFSDYSFDIDEYAGVIEITFNLDDYLNK